MIVDFCSRATCRNKKCKKNQMYMKKYTCDKKNKDTIIDLVDYRNKSKCKGFK